MKQNETWTIDFRKKRKIYNSGGLVKNITVFVRICLKIYEVRFG